MKSQENSEHFIRNLGLFDGIATIICAMIGSGIFIVSSRMAEDVQSSVLLLMAWIIGGFMSMIGALSYGELAASWPEAGGEYVYIKNIWGEFVGFLYGWTQFLIVKTGCIAAVAIAFAKFLSILIPSVTSNSNSFHFLGLVITLQQLIAIVLVILLSVINIKFIKIALMIQKTVTVANIAALSGLILCGVFLGFKFNVININFIHSPIIPHYNADMFAAVGIAVVGALFALNGWNNVTLIAGEMKNTEKNLPLALFIGTGVVSLLYVLINVVYLSALPLKDIANAKNGIVGATFMHTILGHAGETVLAVIILVAAFGCINSLVMGGARSLYAMANDDLLFKGLSHLEGKDKVPQNALLLQGLWSIVLVMSGSFSNLLDYTIFASIIFFMLAVGGLFIARKKFPDIPRPYKAFGYPYLPIIYCVLSIFIAISLLVKSPLYSGGGIVIVLTGIPVYLLWKKKDILFNRNKVESEEPQDFCNS